MPGQTDAERVPRMAGWLEKIEREGEWAVGVEGVKGLEGEIEAFWRGEAERVGRKKERGREGDKGKEGKGTVTEKKKKKTNSNSN